MSWALVNKNSRLKILVMGYLVRGPLGGMAWHHMQYVLGLHNMGHEVYYVEDSGDDKYCCYNPETGSNNEDFSYGMRFAESFFDQLGLGNRWAYFDQHTGGWYGALADKAPDLFRSCDLLLNLSCSNPIRLWASEIPARILVDTDPVFTQIRNLTDQKRKSLTEQHNVFFSFGENISQGISIVPDDGIKWRPTRQPVVADVWPYSRGKTNGKFTTVMQWESYKSREYKSRRYGQKSDSFLEFLQLPELTNNQLQIAMGGGSAPRQELRKHGWQISNPSETVFDPWKYRKFIQRSKGEFSVCKHGYVVSNSGWFSERSAAYLMSGRPVVVQETGFSKWMETGEGVFSFNDVHDVLKAFDIINTNYPLQCKRAREVAQEYFSASKVLEELIESAMSQIKITSKIIEKDGSAF